jgi:hypothetical protein
MEHCAIKRIIGIIRIKRWFITVINKVIIRKNEANFVYNTCTPQQRINECCKLRINKNNNKNVRKCYLDTDREINKVIITINEANFVYHTCFPQ